VLVALESYSYFLAKRSADGRDRTGAGFPGAAEAAITCRLRTGFEVYAQNCASCHGAQGLGQSSGGQVVFPPLWGPRSYNWGAGMTSIKDAAEFIHANMPLGLGGMLSAAAVLGCCGFYQQPGAGRRTRASTGTSSRRGKNTTTRPYSMNAGSPRTAPLTVRPYIEYGESLVFFPRLLDVPVEARVLRPHLAVDKSRNIPRTAAH